MYIHNNHQAIITANSQRARSKGYQVIFLPEQFYRLVIKIYFDTKKYFWIITLMLLTASTGVTGASLVGSSMAASTILVDKAPTQLRHGKDMFILRWGGVTIPVWTYIPTQSRANELPIVIVMHGVDRDGARYRDEWADVAQKKGLIIIAPEFSKKDFPKSAKYNLGNVFRKAGKGYQDEAKWTFSAIEPLFDRVIEVLGSSQTTYTLYGHSAGAQFVHRYLYYKPQSRAKRFLIANAGWYTLPVPNEVYPYGLLGAKINDEALKTSLQKDVVILLGKKDNNPNHRSLRRTPEAMRQGSHRLSRGLNFFIKGKEQADLFGVKLNWRVGLVSNVGHNNKQMALAAAAEFIELNHSMNQE